MSKRSKKRRLRPRQRKILELAKNGMVTVDIIHRAFFPDADVEAVRSALRRLVERGLLQTEKLDDKRVYCRLTRQGARLIAVPGKCAQPMKTQSRIERYAVSWFIHADRPGERARLNPHDYPERFPVTGHTLPKHQFFLERADGRSRLGVIMVDHNAYFRRMPRKVVALLGRFLRHGWFDEYIRQDAFVVAVLTFSEDRKHTFERHVKQAIAEHLRYPLSQLRPDFAREVPSLVEVHVITQLTSIVDESKDRNSK